MHPGCGPDTGRKERAVSSWSCGPAAPPPAPLFPLGWRPPGTGRRTGLLVGGGTSGTERQVSLRGMCGSLPLCLLGSWRRTLTCYIYVSCIAFRADLGPTCGLGLSGESREPEWRKGPGEARDFLRCDRSSASRPSQPQCLGLYKGSRPNASLRAAGEGT